MAQFLFDVVLLLMLPLTSLGLSCVKKDDCSCEMDDGSGIVNITTLGEGSVPRFKDVPASLPGETFLYSFNPCLPFTDGDCVGVNACQYSADHANQYTLGTPADVTFGFEGNNVILIQKHTDQYSLTRTFEVTLICNKSDNDAIFNMKGEVSLAKYEGTLTTRCACPGECSDKPPPSSQGCVRRNQCECEMADGSGIIDLSQIGLRDLHPIFQEVIAPDGFFYSYNPCFPFNEGTCHGAAVCQLSYDLETQYLIGNSSTASFHHDADNKISVIYTAEDNQGTNRTSVVNLICDREATTSTFTAIGEVEKDTYYFSLTSYKVCPEKS